MSLAFLSWQNPAQNVAIRFKQAQITHSDLEPVSHAPPTNGLRACVQGQASALDEALLASFAKPHAVPVLGVKTLVRYSGALCRTEGVVPLAGLEPALR